MTTKTNPMMLPYVVALVATAVAIAIRSAFDPWLGESLPLVTLFGAVAVAVWFGGFGPAVVSAVLGWLACSYLFVEPRYHFSSTLPWALGSVAFALSSGVIIAFGDALYRGRRQARAGVEFLRTTLSSIGDGVITTDADAKVTFVNPVAEDLTGWTRADAVGQPLADVFSIINEVTREPVEAPASEVLRTGKTVGLANHTVLIDRQGARADHRRQCRADPICRRRSSRCRSGVSRQQRAASRRETPEPERKRAQRFLRQCVGRYALGRTHGHDLAGQSSRTRNAWIRERGLPRPQHCRIPCRCRSHSNHPGARFPRARPSRTRKRRCGVRTVRCAMC